MRRDFDTMWAEAGEEVRETYGKEYLDRLFEGAKGTSVTSYPTLAPVLDALEDAVVNQNPRIRYLVDGGSGLMDEFCVSFGLLDFKGILQSCTFNIYRYMNFSIKNLNERKNSK